MLLLLLLCLGLRHAPHDSVYAVATAPLPGGGSVLLIIESDGRILESRDEGLTWEVVVGAGLARQRCWDLAYHPGLSAGGGGLFLIASEDGIWSYDPVTEAVERYGAGLPANDRFVLELAAPGPGSGGPAMALTRAGNLYLRYPGTTAWQLSLQLGSPLWDYRGDVAVNPHFDPQAAAGRARSLAAAANGLLYLSSDGGATWSLHPAFSTAAQSSRDWLIDCVAFSESYTSDGILALGRVRITQNWDEGEIWRSADGGASFQRALQLGTGVMRLACSPARAGGPPLWYAAGRAYPNTGYYHGTGILRSDDGGWTWQEHGSHQDFLLEDEPGLPSGYAPLNYEQGFAFSPDYAQDGRLWYGRQEGLFVSEDEGRHWTQRQTRSEREVRGLSSARDLQGRSLVFSAGYGSGTAAYLLSLGKGAELGMNPMVYQRRVAASPSFASDGTLLAAGNVNLWAWYDPRLPPAGPNGQIGWSTPPVKDPQNGARLAGFPRILAFSPHYSGADPSGDRTFFWCSWDEAPVRSEDGGATAARLGLLSNGAPAPSMECLAVAPTYDAFGAKTDAYAASDEGKVYKLVQDRWQEIAAFPYRAVALIVDPSWSRPQNPRLFVALAGAPYVAAILDLPGGVRVQTLGLNLDGVYPTDLAADPDFAQRPVLYLATWGEGVLKLDGALLPALHWEPVGQNFPAARCQAVALSPDFASDRLVCAGTDWGLYACADRPNQSWQGWTRSALRDDADESFTTYAPGDPANPLPDHAWPWQGVARWNLPPQLNAVGDGFRAARYDGDYVTTFGYARELVLWTVAGPQSGRVTVSAYDFASGALLGSASEDLQVSSTYLRNYQLTLSLAARAKIRVRIDAQLDPGEAVVLDALDFRD